MLELRGASQLWPLQLPPIDRAMGRSVEANTAIQPANSSKLPSRSLALTHVQNSSDRRRNLTRHQVVCNTSDAQMPVSSRMEHLSIATDVEPWALAERLPQRPEGGVRRSVAKDPQLAGANECVAVVL